MRSAFPSLAKREKLIGNGAFAAEKRLCTYADPMAAQMNGNVLDAPQAPPSRFPAHTLSTISTSVASFKKGSASLTVRTPRVSFRFL